MKSVIYLAMLAALLAACSSGDDRFKCIDRGFNWTIYCDTWNDVAYLNVFHGLSVMLDADGLPLKCSEYRKD